MDLWGPIDVAAWRQIACIVGRAATEGDVKAGRAVFFCGPADVTPPEPLTDVPLPACALQSVEGQPDPVPVVVIQVERLNTGLAVAGVRYLSGGNGICTLAELTILADGPDERFVRAGG